MTCQRITVMTRRFLTRKLAWALLIPLACFAVSPAHATCTVTWTSLSFGTYTGSLLNGVNTGTVNCSLFQQYIVGLNAGTGSGATETLRKMSGPAGATLSYQLFMDAARTTNWGDTPGNEYTGTGTGSRQTLTVYSQIPAGQGVVPGTYTDTISSATASFQVTAVVQANCTLSATPLAFGTYTGALTNATSTLTISCTKNTAYNVGLSAGLATGATVTTRKMSGPGAALLAYSLFRDAGHTQNWGNTVGTNTQAGTGSGSAQPLTVYGQIPASQVAAPGSYTDTITATVTY
jgi:spore coat protein U-like protein